MKFVIKKTDKRHSGNAIFEYVVDIQSPGMGRRRDRLQQFLLVREWCWTAMGASCERDHWLFLHDTDAQPNDRWCWHTDFGNFKIYLCTEKEANWFKLKWL